MVAFFYFTSFWNFIIYMILYLQENHGFEIAIPKVKDLIQYLLQVLRTRKLEEKILLAGRNYELFNWHYRRRWNFEKKLLLTNVKNIKNGIYFEKVFDELKIRYNSRGTEYTYHVAKTLTKLKRCISICRNTLLKAKTASGIKRFQ